MYFYLQFGQGNYGASALLSWQDPEPHPVNGIALTTASGFDGHWRYDRKFGKGDVIPFIPTTPKSCHHSHLKSLIQAYEEEETKLALP